MSTFSLTKSFTALLESLHGISKSDSLALVCATGHLPTCPTKGSTPCFWCSAATMTPQLVTAATLFSSMTESVAAPLASWPSAIRARMALFELAELGPPPQGHSETFSREFFKIVHDRGATLEHRLNQQGRTDSELERSVRLASAITALPRMAMQPAFAPRDAAFRTRLSALAGTKSLQLETMAILVTEQLLAGQFMDYGPNGRALADLAQYLGAGDAQSFQDLQWLASFYARRDDLVELAEILVELEEPTMHVTIPQVTQHYPLRALQSLVLRAQPIDWATTFVHTTGALSWRHGDDFLVTPSVVLALQVWADRRCASAIGITEVA